MITRVGSTVLVIAVVVGCADLGDVTTEGDRSSVCRDQKSLVAPSTAATLLSAKVKSSELLVNAASRNLPLTGESFYEGKFLDTKNDTITIRAYDGSGSPVDRWKLRAAERAARRVKYGAWTPAQHSVLQGASKAQLFKASLWIPFEPPTGGKAANVAAVTAAKAAVRAAMKTYNVKELWTDPEAPILVVEGAAADLLTIGAMSDVGRAALHDDSYKVQALAVGDADEKVDMGFPTLEHIHGDMVSGSIVHWDLCLPTTGVTSHQASSNKMFYIPLSQVNFSDIPFASRDNPTGFPNCQDDFGQRHAERSTGIIAAGRIAILVDPGSGRYDLFSHARNLGTVSGLAQHASSVSTRHGGWQQR